jgi:hypothetical protein
MDSMTEVSTRKTREPFRKAEPLDHPLPRPSDRGQGIRDFFNDALGPPRPERATRWPRRVVKRFARQHRQEP